MLFTIGYSPFFDSKQLLNRLKQENISEIYDIRTFPYSNAFPQYNKENFNSLTEKNDINYTFLGDFLGGLIIKETVKRGINSLKDLLKNKNIKNGLNYIYKKSKEKNIAIMCAEKSPFDCHRFLGVASVIQLYTDIEVKNIIGEKTLSFEDTINWWKKENNLTNLTLEVEKIIFQRLNKLYKIDNKREEKFPEKLENLKLFK